MGLVKVMAAFRHEPIEAVIGSIKEDWNIWKEAIDKTEETYEIYNETAPIMKMELRESKVEGKEDTSTEVRALLPE